MPESIKVLQVIFSLEVGGAERIVLDLVRGGPGFGFSSDVATLGRRGELVPQAQAAGARHLHLGKRPGLDWRMVGAIRRAARSLGTELIHAHNEGPALYAGLAGRLAGLPVVTTRHGLSFHHQNLWLRRAAGLLTHCTVCVSRQVQELALKRDRLPASRLVTIHNGVDLSAFQPQKNPALRRQVRKSLGLDPQRPLVISVGRLAPEKDYPTLLAALERLPGAQLLLVGEGRSLPELKALAARPGLAGRVCLAGVRHDVPRLLAASDCFALSSLSEGVSKSLLEAMACGLPVAATAVGGTPEVVLAERTGLLVPPRDPQALAVALGRLLADEDYAAELGRAGRRRVQEHFSLEAMLSAYARLYRRLLD